MFLRARILHVHVAASHDPQRFDTARSAVVSELDDAYHTPTRS